MSVKDIPITALVLRANPHALDDTPPTPVPPVPPVPIPPVPVTPEEIAERDRIIRELNRLVETDDF
jgi:hypothetical protein